MSDTGAKDGPADDLSREQRDVMLYLQGRPEGVADAELFDFIEWAEHAEARHDALVLFRAGMVRLRLRPDGEVEALAVPPAADPDDGRAA